jgi:Bacteriophage tail sheath protein
MVEFLAPGVYIEEVPGSAHTIEGVSTSTGGLVGAAHAGPIDTATGPITGLSEFERNFGEGSPLAHDGLAPIPCFLWHAARAFFNEGGKRLWVARVFRAGTSPAGERPQAEDFERGLAALDAIEEVAIVAAPGSSYAGATTFGASAAAISAALIAHAERGRNRVALLDPPDGLDVAQVHAWRARFASNFAALYFPWIRDPGGVLLPPSGFVMGVYARTDIERGVWTAPGNATLHGVGGLEQDVDSTQQTTLNTDGINTIRSLPGRGTLVWGARTLARDPEWKYVNVRRYLIFLEESIHRGLQWAVFEPDADPLWQGLRLAVADFLINEWRTGALKGSRPEEAFFVRCDRSTMTQGDIDNGRAICLVGVAALRPAEFIIFRVGVQTAV